MSSPGVGSKSIHRRDSGREHIDLEHSGEQGTILYIIKKNRCTTHTCVPFLLSALLVCVSHV